MAVEIEILDHMPIMLVRCSGRATIEQVLDTYLEYLDGPNATPDKHYLVDLSRVTLFDMDFARVLDLVAKLRPVYAMRADDSRTAIWAPHDTGFGVARMYQSTASALEDVTINVFRDLNEALHFLDADPYLASEITDA